jgi:hypothetical protein
MKKKQEKPAPQPLEDRNLYGPSTSHPVGIERMMKGRIIDGRRYLGGGCWEVVDHETAETNERREGRP